MWKKLAKTLNSIVILLICSGALTSCNKQPMGIPNSPETETQGELVENNSEFHTEALEENTIDIRGIDYSEYFDDKSGCAVIYSSKDNCYYAFNKPKIDMEVSPYSTFKIVGALMGLNNNIVEDENSIMNYNGTDYSVEAWNKNLTLKEAFQTSCVWYFRQVQTRIKKAGMLESHRKMIMTFILQYI